MIIYFESETKMNLQNWRLKGDGMGYLGEVPSPPKFIYIPYQQSDINKKKGCCSYENKESKKREPFFISVRVFILPNSTVPYPAGGFNTYEKLTK